MLFSSITFLYLFLPILFIFYYINKDVKYKNIILIIFSLIFYATGEPVYVILLIIITYINYLLSKVIYNSNEKISLVVFVLTLTIDILTLIYFKYFNLIIDTINIICRTSFNHINVTLPLGISFFTFQIISYIIDVKIKIVTPEKRYANFLLYVSLFPQLIAGPIVRYSDIRLEIEDRVINAPSIIRGAYRFSVGLAKKVLIANVLGKMSVALFSLELSKVSILSSWFMVIIYALQLYFDFSGYSDMAIGLSKMFGFNLLENFNYPYISTSITEFWTRWHISLSSFFRDYVFIPISLKTRKTYLSLFIVWFLTGLWHGASYNFILWGLFYFVILSIEKLFLLKLLKRLPSILRKIIGFIYTVFFVILANNIFYRTDLSNLFNSFKVMFGLTGNEFYDLYFVSLFKENFFLIILAMILSTPLLDYLTKKLFYRRSHEMVIKTIFIIILVFLSTIELLSNSYNPFLYFRF